MVDRLTPEARSRLMAAVKGKNTTPELKVRKLAHSLGFRFRLHRRDLPGMPDLVFPTRRKVVFVHGCFWHRHPGCRKASTPSSHGDFWQAKFSRNVDRDARNERQLRDAGWDVLVIWECETRDAAAVAERLTAFLGPPGRAKPAAPD
ncbi:very short patch repair endonuclease [Methylobacterium nodulans]|uniref:Very short patch repair endonuclease n=1 Tax=Methylobacterium nodulans (strain LMG 21967 / CNCM I-2342 / ORS 2060) TaxID=460265 RepID=B8IIZ2_METNO|nr:very short patch repair endonuclease [Methylobacterium nodulans]ACL61787.1 DNA mismatch endonuclease Vsr [Methylobacterium nodulans ORS 2060]